MTKSLNNIKIEASGNKIKMKKCRIVEREKKKRLKKAKII